MRFPVHSDRAPARARTRRPADAGLLSSASPRLAVRALVYVLIVCSAGLGVAGPATAKSGGDTPQQVFETVRAALGSGDVAGLLEQVAPSQRKVAAIEIFVAAPFAIAFSDNAEALDQGMRTLLEKHHSEALLDDSKKPGFDADQASIQRAGEELFESSDEVAFTRDLFTFMRENGVMDFKPPADLARPLESLAIDGDVATATWGAAPVTFRREDGRWYVDSAFKPAG